MSFLLSTLSIVAIPPAYKSKSIINTFFFKRKYIPAKLVVKVVLPTPPLTEDTLIILPKEVCILITHYSFYSFIIPPKKPTIKRIFRIWGGFSGIFVRALRKVWRKASNLGLSVSWVSSIKGGMGAKPPSPNTVAGSPEGGLERLGAHRKVQEKSTGQTRFVFSTQGNSRKASCGFRRASGRSRPPPTPPAGVSFVQGLRPCTPYIEETHR